jgi:hypothetical protein
MRRVKHLLDRGGLALLAAVLVCGVTLLIGALAGDRPQQVSAAPPPPPGVVIAATGCTPAPAATATPTSTPTDTPTATFVAPTATPTDTPTATFVAPTATPTDTPTATFVAPTATPTDTPTATFVAPTATPTDTPTATFSAQRVSAQAAGEPVGCWRMGEPSGTTMIDSSGNGNDGTYIGGVVLNQPGAVAGDTAALYDGVNDTARVPDDNSLDVGNSFSIEGWIKRSSTTKTHELFNKGANGFQLVVMNAASLNRVLLRRAGVTAIAQSTVPVLADGQYHHVVATMNGPGTAKIYVDGALASASLSPVQAIQNTAFPLTFGSAASTPAQYDEFALYDDVLSQQQVTDHHNAGS